MKRKNHMEWAWTLLIAFLTLGIYDFRFGILGLLCMIAPIYHAVRGRGKAHCQSYCPRGSILNKFLSPLSFNKNLPKFMTQKGFKIGLLIFMVSVFGYSLSHTGFHFAKVSFVVFRFISISLVVSLVLGIFFRPRSWCVVCPMGYTSGLIAKQYPPKKLVTLNASNEARRQAA